MPALFVRGAGTHGSAPERGAPRRGDRGGLRGQRRRPLALAGEPFLDDMPARFARAHLVMSRSGASTVAEVAAAGKPALLVPFAAAADEHQRRNAEAMVAAGAAVMLQEKDLEIPEQAAGRAHGPLERSGAAGRDVGRRPHPGASRRGRAHR